MTAAAAAASIVRDHYGNDRSARNIFKTSSEFSESRFPVGSSARTIAGRFTTARPSDPLLLPPRAQALVMQLVL
jgi:hypothetical protein